jgi:hypothetical protein
LREGGVYVVAFPSEEWLNDDTDYTYLYGDLDVLFEIDDNGRIYSNSDIQNFARFDGRCYTELVCAIRSVMGIPEEEPVMTPGPFPEYDLIEWRFDDDIQCDLPVSGHKIHAGTKLELPEFSGVVFEYMQYQLPNEFGGYSWATYIKAVYPSGEEKVITFFGTAGGDRVFVADLIGNGFPQFIYETSITSGVFTRLVIVYDFANDETYSTSGYHGVHTLSVENGRIIVTQIAQEIASGTVHKVEFGGELVFMGGQLVIIGGQLANNPFDDTTCNDDDTSTCDDTSRTTDNERTACGNINFSRTCNRNRSCRNCQAGFHRHFP